MGIFVQEELRYWVISELSTPLIWSGMVGTFPGSKQWPESFGGIWQNHQWFWFWTIWNPKLYRIWNRYKHHSSPLSKAKLTLVFIKDLKKEFCHFPLLIWVLIWICNLSYSMGRFPLYYRNRINELHWKVGELGTFILFKKQNKVVDDGWIKKIRSIYIQWTIIQPSERMNTQLLHQHGWDWRRLW